MRGRVKVLSLLVSLLSFDLLADCSLWSQHTSMQYRTTALDLSVDGDLLWLATGYGVQLIDDGTAVASIALPGSTRVVRAQGNGYAYAGSGANVYVLQRQGHTIRLVTTIAAPGTVNDLLIASNALFAATTNGIAHYDILNPTAPLRTNVNLPSSSPNVASLASAKNKLYAADGDASIETYSITIPSLPQHIGTLASVPFASSVHATTDDHLFVSDRFGQSTDLFLESVSLGRMQLGTTAFAASSGKTHFVAGPDRTIRAVNFTTPSRIAEIYSASLAPTDGTDNVIHAMARVDDTLYVAAGDIGLVALDATTLAPPYPFVSYGSGSATSVRVNADKAWFSNAAGKITQQRIDASGIALVEERSWDAAVGSVVRDYRDNGLLTSTGSTATLWSLVSATPAQATNVTFPAAVANAVKSDNAIVALLVNGTVWAAPNGSSTPAQVNVPATSLIARSGSAIAIAEVRVDDAKTVIRYYANGDLGAEPVTFTLDGAATGSIALDATRAAVFTFNGISILDLVSKNVRVIDGSNLIIPRQMAFASDDLLVMDATSLLVYDDARTLLRHHALPYEGIAFDAASSIAAIATTKGPAASRYLVELPQPETEFTSAFYTKLAAGNGRAYLFDGESIDIYSTVIPERPTFVTKFDATGTVDLAANDTSLFTIAGNGDLTAYSRAGVQTARVNLREGFDTQMIGVRVASNALFVSLGTGCSLQGCTVRKTVVVDPNSLAVTATLTGNLTDVVASGTKAYALFAFPDEIRVLNIANPLQPSQINAAAVPPFGSSIAYSAGKIYVLNGKVFGYSEVTLAQVEERLTTVAVKPVHRIRIEGTCAMVSRDPEPPVLYDLPSWNASATQFALPSPLRAFAIQPSMLLMLTDHSLEVEHNGAAGTPRRRAVR